MTLTIELVEEAVASLKESDVWPVLKAAFEHRLSQHAGVMMSAHPATVEAAGMVLLRQQAIVHELSQFVHDPAGYLTAGLQDK